MTEKKKTEAVMPAHMVAHILKNAGPDVILVGDQSLAYWVARYGISLPENVAYMSRDIDFLAASPDMFAEVTRFARIINGSTLFPREHALTALIGQAVKIISDDEYLNIDVLYKVLQGTDAVRKRAVRATYDGIPITVMHPTDVLASRLINLHKLPQKQNDMGAMQMAVAIEVGRAYMHAIADDPAAVQTTTKIYMGLALSDAGRKVAAKWGLHVADAIEPSLRFADPNFIAHQLQDILGLMSEQRRTDVEKDIIVHRPDFSPVNSFPADS